MLIPKASSFSRLPVTSISASSSCSFIEHLLVVYGHARMIQDSKRLFVVQHRCMTFKIDVSHTKLIYVILKFVLIQQNIDVSTFDILSVKKRHSQSWPRMCSRVRLNFAVVIFQIFILLYFLAVFEILGQPCRCFWSFESSFFTVFSHYDSPFIVCSGLRARGYFIK